MYFYKAGSRLGGGGGLIFFEVLYSFRVRQGDVDRIGSCPSKRSKFEVKLFYQVLTSPNRFFFSLEEYLESQGVMAHTKWYDIICFEL
jgi:hypothetical protein